MLPKRHPLRSVSKPGLVIASAAPVTQMTCEYGPSAGPSLMVDAYDPNLYGGTGKAADWRVAAELAKQYPGLLLAGSLIPENVAEAIRVARPWGVEAPSTI